MLRGFFVAISRRFAILKQKTNGKKMTEQQRQLPTEIMKKAVRGISYIAHPLRRQRHHRRHRLRTDQGFPISETPARRRFRHRLPAGTFHHLQHHQRRAQNLHRMYPQTLRFACRQIAVLIFSPAAAEPVLSRREPVSAAPRPAAAPFAKKPNPPERLTSQNHESFR